MKFEKFFKSVGTHGSIVKINDSEKWLVCGGVGMKIPIGVNNLGVEAEPEAVIKAIIHADTDEDVLTLDRAILNDPEGKANQIIRIFRNAFDTIGIYNADYSLLERKDKLTYLEIEDDENEITRSFVIVSNNYEIIGFIEGCDKDELIN